LNRIYSQFRHPVYKSIDDKIINQKLKIRLAIEMINELELDTKYLIQIKRKEYTVDVNKVYELYLEKIETVQEEVVEYKDDYDVSAYKTYSRWDRFKQFLKGE